MKNGPQKKYVALLQEGLVVMPNFRLFIRNASGNFAKLINL
jgi:hypothetical protein